MKANYHSHTFYCDGSEHPEKYIKEAIRKKLFAYGYSSHAPVNFKTDWNIKKEDFHKYISDVKEIKRKYANDIEVYLGLEIDYIPDIAGKDKYLNASADLDYFIGSVHFVDSFTDGTPWNIDTSKTLFDKGLKEIFSNDFRKAVEKFYAITREMIEKDNPTIVGHLDKIKMFASKGRDFHENESWYIHAVYDTLRVIKKWGPLVEINTRGIYRYQQTDLYPSTWIIEMMKEMNIPMVLNSDAHRPDEITGGFDYALNELKKAGVNELFIMKKGNWKSEALL
jgi:histidinol-phosphatase (PHP family)